MDNVPNIGSVPFTPRPAQDKPDLKAPKTTSDFELLIEQVDSTDSEQQGRRRAQVQPEDDTEENDTSSGFAQEETPPQPTLRSPSLSYVQPTYASTYELTSFSSDLPEPLSYGGSSSSSSSGPPSTQAPPPAENALPRRRRTTSSARRAAPSTQPPQAPQPPAKPKRSRTPAKSTTTAEPPIPVKGTKAASTRKSGRARMEALMAPPTEAKEQPTASVAARKSIAPSKADPEATPEATAATVKTAKEAVKKTTKSAAKAAVAQPPQVETPASAKTKAAKKTQAAEKAAQAAVEAAKAAQAVDPAKVVQAAGEVAHVESGEVSKSSKATKAPKKSDTPEEPTKTKVEKKKEAPAEEVAATQIATAHTSPTPASLSAEEREEEERTEAAAQISMRTGLLYLAEAAVQHLTPAPKGHVSKITPLAGRPLPHPSSQALVNVQGVQSAHLNPALSVAIEGQPSVTTTTAIPKSAALDRVIQAMRNALLTLVEKPGMRELSLTLRGVPGLAGSALEGLKITVQEYTTLAPGQYNITIQANATAQAMLAHAVPAMLAELNQNTRGYTVQRLEVVNERPFFHRKGAAGGDGGGGAGGDRGKEKG